MREKGLLHNRGIIRSQPRAGTRERPAKCWAKPETQRRSRDWISKKNICGGPKNSGKWNPKGGQVYEGQAEVEGRGSEGGEVWSRRQNRSSDWRE